MFTLFKNPDKAKDPVCLMKVSKGQGSKNYMYKSKTYYFCSASCYEEFKENPAKYAD